MSATRSSLSASPAITNDQRGSTTMELQNSKGGLELGLGSAVTLHRMATLDESNLSWCEKIYVMYKAIDYSSPGRVYVASLLEGGYVTTLMTVLTMWALYAEDFKIATTDVDADRAFSWLAFVALLAFFGEWVLASWSTQSYLFSFFFWLDFVATISLIPDILFMSEAFGLSAGGDGADPSSARAGRAARAGTRAGRIVRIVRLVRIGKLSKQFFAWWDKRSKKDEEDHSGTGADEDTENFEDETQPSNLGSHLSQLITKRIFVVPFLGMSEREELFSMDNPIAELDFVFQKHGGEDIYDKFLEWWVQDYTGGLSVKKKLIYLQVNGSSILNDKEVISRLRLTETEKFDYGVVSAMLSVEKIRITDAWKSVGLTTFLIFMLTVLAVIFNNDTNEYVIVPINAMVSSVRRLTENPMADHGGDEDAGEFETAMLQGTITRIGKLLQLGFGHAGSEIIKASLSSNLAANVGGKRVNAIFGFCDIRNFTDATECLQQDIMNFVNEVASIVHDIVVMHGGAPNKNVGDAFLLVWSLPDNSMGDEEITISTLADSALMALVKIVISINEKNKNQFMKYRTNEAIIKRMGVDWEVKLGWGLHTGWAIEGAIGSRFKIDASYLSPHVNLSEDLEGATKFYGVPFLVSEAMVNILSPFARSLCRRVDRVKIAGIEAPFDLYCVDVWQWHRDKLKKMGLATEGPFVGKFRAHRGKSYTRSEKKFFTDKELRGIHEGIPEKHSKLWAEALQLYLDGDWGKAKIICQQTLDLLPTDYCCQAILGYMGKFSNKAPNDWAGYRMHE